MKRASVIAVFAPVVAALVLTWSSRMAVAAEPNVKIESPRVAREVVVSVADFGADPTGGACSYKAFAAAIDACRERKATKLVVPKGKYVFRDDAILKARAHFTLDGLSDFTFDGGGSEFIFHHIRHVMLLANCHRVVVRGFTVDWDIPMGSPGVVVEHEGKKVIRVDDGWAVDKTTPVTAITSYDTKNLKWSMDPIEVYDPKDVQYIAPQMLAHERFAAYPLGHTVVVRHYVYQATAFLTTALSGDIAFEDITVYQCPGMTWGAWNVGRGFRFSRLTIARRPGTKNLISAAADGIWFGGALGGILVEDCNFSHQGDDSFNVHGFWVKVTRKLSARQVQVFYKWGAVPLTAPGDEVKLARRYTLEEYWRGKVAKVERDDPAKTATITLDADLPADFAAEDWLGNITRAAPDYIVRRNNFHDHRARGMLLQAANGLVEKNHITNVMAAAIQMTTDGNYWYEGYECRNVTIRDNVIEHCSYANWERNDVGRHMACINLVADVAAPPGGPAPARLSDGLVHSGIVIEGNTIKDTPGLAILISSARDVTIRKNTIIDSNTQPFDHTGEKIDAKAGGSIYITRSQDVVVEQNVQKTTVKTYASGVCVDAKTTKNVKTDE